MLNKYLKSQWKSSGTSDPAASVSPESCCLTSTFSANCVERAIFATCLASQTSPTVAVALCDVGTSLFFFFIERMRVERQDPDCKWGKRGKVKGNRKKEKKEKKFQDVRKLSARACITRVSMLNRASVMRLWLLIDKSCCCDSTAWT